MTLWGQLKDESWCFAGQLPGTNRKAPAVKIQIEAARDRYLALVIRTDDGLTVLDRLAGRGTGEWNE